MVALRTPDVRLSAIIPTLNRREMLACTLPVLLKELGGGDEAIVIDNGSSDGTVAQLRPRFPRVRWIELDRNIACAARNVGAAAADGDVLIMMDDDSVPEHKALEGIRTAFAGDPRLGALSCRIRLMNRPDRHDHGGLAGVVVNSGSAIRREAFLSVGGYPIDFDYYAEEDDLCCRLWLGGWRVEPRGDLAFLHARAPNNRDPARVAGLLARDNLAVWDRYAPDPIRQRLMDQAAECRPVGVIEGATRKLGAAPGDRQKFGAHSTGRRQPLTQEQFENLFGLSDARRRLRMQRDELGVRRVGVWGRGRGCPQLIELLRELEMEPVAVYEQRQGESRWNDCPLRDTGYVAADGLDALIPGTLSLGAAADVAADLRSSFPDVPTLKAIDWTSVSRETAAHG